MTAAVTRRPDGGDAAAAAMSLSDLVLVRIASAPTGATRAELQRDIAPIFGPRSAGTQFRRAAELAISASGVHGFITEHKGRLTATASGKSAAEKLLSLPKPPKIGWDAARDALVGQAMGIGAMTAAADKAFSRVDGLAGLVLQHHFGITPHRALSMQDLRTELAVIALERAFGNRIKTGLGKAGVSSAGTRGGSKSSGLPGKTGRLLAGQLFKAPREIGSDGKLVIALAAEIVGTNDETLDGFKLALLRSLIRPATIAPDDARASRTKVRKAADRAERRQPTPLPDNDANPMASQAPPAMRAAVHPDMAEFASAVVDAARPVSEGWPGNRKAFISLVWRAIREARPDWGLSEIAFKGMLAEAHRSGHVVLAGADLKDRCDLKALEDSKILYKNTVWHFVRVED